jgi:HEAT repeat protein
MLRAKDSVLKVKLMDLTRKQHIINIQYTRDGELNYEAGKGFEALGAKANSVVPKVIDIADANVSFDSQYYAMAALRAIGQPGEEALPSLLRAATNANYVLRSYAITALGSLHAEPERVVPVLINALHDADSNVRLDASNALKHIDPRAAAVEGMK